MTLSTLQPRIWQSDNSDPPTVRVIFFRQLRQHSFIPQMYVCKPFLEAELKITNITAQLVFTPEFLC
jgi:hypothetical protein